jgi:hypothetical protein
VHAVVVPIRRGTAEAARGLIEEGRPFDVEDVGLERHHVFVSEREVVFFFEGESAAAAVDALTRSPVHVDAHIAFLGDERLTRVDPNPHADRTASEPGVAFRRCGQRIRRPLESNEERVSLRIDFNPTMARKRPAKEKTVLREHNGVTITKLVEQPRRALHIREKKRDGATGQLGHIWMMRPRPRLV